MSTYRTTPAYAGGGLGIRFALARLVTAAAAIAAGIIALAIILHVLGAKTSNSVERGTASWPRTWAPP